MIETMEGMSNLEAILDVEGVAGAYVGRSDLRLSAGVALQLAASDPALAIIHEYCERVARACGERGLFSAMHCDSVDEAKLYIEMGFRLVSVSTDAEALRTHAHKAVTSFRALHG
jgi:4-hydroxy-2-oxoheptanedioate aldolase